MYVVIGSSEYRKISTLRFEPEADVVGSSVPVNEISVDIITEDQIAAGSRISLYDDTDKLWAKYWVIYADRKDKQTVTVKGQSALKQLERDMLPAEMYDNAAVSTVLQTVLAQLHGEYVLDPSFSTASISGFCPQQSARNRFQWICLVIGAYVKDFFNDKLEILPVDSTLKIIPKANVFWKPTVNYGEYVTAVRAYYYTYIEQTPSTTDTWIEANGRYYVQTEHQVTLRNTNVPQNALEHVVTVKDVTIVNQSNVDDILSNMALYYFLRTTVSFDAVNDGNYMPAQKVCIPVDDENLANGYITSCSFSFGAHAKSKIELTAADIVPSANVIVIYNYGNVQIGRRQFRLPVGYSYELDTQYIDVAFGGHRYVFSPTQSIVSGTVASTGNIHNVPVEMALDYINGNLYIRGADSVTLHDGSVSIG